MCTSIVSNGNKTIVGWNLDLLDMEYRVRPNDLGVFIEINDKTEGWMPIFGANKRGDFVAMPMCWPHDKRSDPQGEEPNIILLDIDLLMMKKTLSEVKEIAQNGKICSVPGLTFMSSLSDSEGNVLQIVPGQGASFFTKPKYKVLTNFSPYKMNSETHPWMGWDRYLTAKRMLEKSSDDLNVDGMFDILKAVSQTVCPTVVSMVLDVKEGRVYWCEERRWNEIRKVDLKTL